MTGIDNETEPRGFARILFGIVSALETVSLDVAAGAVGCAIFVGSVSGATAVSGPLLLALGSTVLVVYNLDHYLDSHTIPQASSLRRQGYRKYRIWLKIFGVSSAIVACTTLWFVPARSWVPGIALVAYQMLYFIGLKLGLRGFAKRLAASTGGLPEFVFPPGSIQRLRNPW